MTVVAPSFPAFDNSFVRELEGLYVPWRAAAVPAPRLLALNEDLAADLGLDAGLLRTPEGVATLVGNVVPEGAAPVAQAYAGHQFGGYSPSLGDGRALLLGEIIDRQDRRRDLHLKGSGRTPFARGGDGKAAVGPMLREYVIGEAMHALGIPTSRALAVVATGDLVARETMLPGAVLTRVAASHIRVGTFEYAARRDPALVQRLADYAIARHYPHAADAPATVFSSIDHGGRYAYGNQPRIALWNLARLAETLLPLLGAETETAVAAATEVLESFPDRYREYRAHRMGGKLGLTGVREEDESLGDDLLALMHAQGVDYTSCFRALSSALRGDAARARSLFADPSRFDAWSDRWLARLSSQASDLHATADGLDRVNPVYIPRNHQVEEALAAATAGDMSPFHELVDVIVAPFQERPGLDAYTAPAPPSFGAYRTFCGT